MKKLENDIEKRLKDSFENQEFEIEDAWLNDMSEKLDAFNEKPKRRFGFWLFFGALLLGGVSSAYFYNNFTYKKNKTQQDVFESLIESFKMTGGVPKEILFDNMKTVGIHIYEIRQLKSCQITAKVDYLDFKSNQLLQAFPLTSEYVFENIYRSSNSH